MFVTLFTDASFSRRLSRGTWACWFKNEGQTWRYSGILRETIVQSGDGELMAIANGLVAVVKKLEPKKGDKILVQTDSVEAIHALRCGAHVRPIAPAAVKHVKALQEAHGFTYILRHVKGHKGAATPRNAVNTWCDRECRRLMGTLLAGNADQLALPGIGE